MTRKTKKYTYNLPTVALVGRTNVGKSTLFNRLTEQESAIVSEKRGTTRTSNEELVWWRGKAFQLIDTGGMDFEDHRGLEDKILDQVEKAKQRADLIVFVTDGQGGILKQEKRIAKQLQKSDTEVLLTVNKIDDQKNARELVLEDWYKLGFGEPIKISAKNGRNVGDFLDEIYKKLQETEQQPKDNDQQEKIIDVSIIGRPNAGKSSLFNQLIGEQEVIVNEQAHTTREPHDTLVIYPTERLGGDEKKDQKIRFVDTAGIRKKTKVEEGIEKKGVQKSIEAIEKSDVVLFVIDGSRKISKQDKKLGNLLKNKLKSVIILINKWDLAQEDNPEKRDFVKEMFYSDFPHLKFAPILFISALTGRNVHKIFPYIIKAWKARQLHIQQEGLDSFLKSATKKHTPTKGKGTKPPKLKGLKQINTNPIVFELYIKEGTHLADSYINYLSNRLREQFDLFATPVRIKPKKVK